MKKQFEQHLSSVLTRLEKAHSEIAKSKGYTKDSEKVKLLIELVKEQVSNENTRHSAR